jgi:steroid delta-isomerase-like uncharacterized protein
MSLEKNKAIVRSFWEAFNKHNVAFLDDFVAPGYFDRRIDGQLRGPEESKQYLTAHFNGFPDAYVTIEDIIAEGDKVWVLITETGTHKGEIQGLAPTGKKIKIKSVQFARIVNGKIVEGAVYVADELAFYKQLGVIK